MKPMLALLILSLLITSCTGIAPKPAEAQVAQSELPREAAPQVTDAELEVLVAGNTAFALDLYQRLRERDGNVFFSPYSISVALAMTYAGARGATAEQMAQVLHFTLEDAALHRAFNALDLMLAAQSAAAPGDTRELFELHVANSLWAEQEHSFLPEFLDTLAQNYGAGLNLVSFKTAAEAARQAINAWVEAQTEQRIRDLIPEGGVDALTRLVLANAIYFNAGWMYPFEEDLTAEGEFTALSGAVQMAPMMRWSSSNRVGYAEGAGYQAVELPYQGGKASMVLLVPEDFEAFEAELTGARLQELIAGLEAQSVTLMLPAFEVEASFKLAETLQQLGMTEAFDPVAADFSGMTGVADLYIGAVFHKAFVRVDEAGTEAAAATAVVMQLKGMPMAGVELTVDRPFLYLVRDVQSGAVLFMGRVVEVE
ncbi:MAG: serpin family protein [Anaerolineae bacterium]|jgi:serpin B|nr:serpin family protein [Anaerolineae bacterium]